MFSVAFKHVRNVLLPRGSFNLLANSPAIMHIPRANVTKTPMEPNETDDEFIDRMECYFNRADIDGWELRKGLNDLTGMDLIPDPRIILAALCACRRCNDYACTTRLLEMVKFKCADQADTIYPYLMEIVRPAMDELGVEPLEKMGYDEPELALIDIYDLRYNPAPKQ